MLYFVYILQGRDNSFYTGITRNLKRRLEEHNKGEVPFTKSKRPLKLVYLEKFHTREEAAKREKEIKGWRREKKEKLINLYQVTESLRRGTK
jgi:putative endonuclease